MKNVILSLAILCSSMSYAQITATLNAQLVDYNGVPAPGLDGIVEIYDNTQQLWLQAGVTSDAQGAINFTNSLPQSGFWVLAIWDACTNINTSPPSVVKTYSFSPNTPNSYNVSDTVMVACPNTTCNFPILAAPISSPSFPPMSFTFGSGYFGGQNSTYLWDFGDGNTSNIALANHTYTNPGTYQYCLTVDSCTVCDSLVATSNSPGANCNFQINASNNGATNLDYSFWTTYNNQNPNSVYSWDFGDGNTGTGSLVTHSYASTGTYNVCVAVDSCTVCDTLVVTSSNAACMAEFIVDTVNSINGDVVLWNTSTLSSPNAAYQFTWDFGDGNFSNQDFPTHFYNQAGVYNVCLTLTEANGCTSTYCDSLGMDQNGNLIYKGQSTGFKLVVIDPATIGQEEKLDNQVAIYPNPAEEILYINGMDQRGELIIQDLQGRIIRKEKLEAQQNELRIDELVKGVYIFQILSGSEQIRHIQIVD